MSCSIASCFVPTATKLSRVAVRPVVTAESRIGEAHRRAAHDDDRQQHEVAQRESPERARRQLGNAHRSSVYGRSPRRNATAPFGTLARNAPSDPRHDLRGVRGRGGRRRGRGAVGRGRLRRRRRRGVGLRRRTSRAADPTTTTLPPPTTTTTIGRRGAANPSRSPSRATSTSRARCATSWRPTRPSVLAPIAPVLRRGRPHGRQPRDRRHRRRDARSRRSSRSGHRRTALTALAAGGIDVATHGEQPRHGLRPGRARRTRSPRGRAAAFPSSGSATTRPRRTRPYTTVIKGQRIAVIGATQVLDDNLITAWTATDDAGRARVGEGRRRLVAAVQGRARRQRHRRRVPALGCREGRRARAATPAGTGAPRSSTPAPTSSSGATRTGCWARAASAAAFVGYGLGNFVFYAQGGPGTETGVLKVTATGRRHRRLRVSPGGDPAAACRVRSTATRPRPRRSAVERLARLHRPRTLRSTAARDRVRRVRPVPRERRGVRHPVARCRRTCGASRSTSAPASDQRARLGHEAAPELVLSTAARRTRTPGTPSRSRSTVRSSRSTFPATGTRRTATTTCTGRRDNAVARRDRRARARARRARSSSACRSAG